jgi:hypothetical protein
MTHLLWHVIGDPSVNQLGILDEEKDDRYTPSFNWNYRMRTCDTEYFTGTNLNLWTASYFASGDPLNGIAYIVGQDMIDGSWYEPWSLYNSGTNRPSFVIGNVQLGGGSPLAAANVDLFLTSTNQFVSSGITDTNGNYMLPTPFAGQNHYVYANYANVYVGSSINTLTPNF